MIVNGRLKFSYWFAVILVMMSFALPTFHGLHAVEMEGHIGQMDMDCEGGDCENIPAQQSCLEQCLQSAATQVVIPAIAPHQIEVPQGRIASIVFAHPARKTVRTTILKTGPPREVEQHLTVQKRE